MGIFIPFLFIFISNVALLPTLEATYDYDCYKVKGKLVPAFTNFDQNGTLDITLIGAYAQYLNAKGADGVIVGGTTGEGPSLNVTENKILLDAWMKATEATNLIVIASVGGVPIPDTLELAAYAEFIGVAALFVLPPVYYKPQNVDQLLSYFELVAQAAPETYLVYDDNPQYTCVNVDIVSFFEKITNRMQNFMGVKSSVFENLILLRPLLTGQQQLYAADYFYLAPEVCLGFENFALREFNFFPDLITDIIRYREKGNVSRSTNLYQRLLDLVAVIIGIDNDNELAAEKAAMEILTCIEVGPTRLYPLCYEQREDITQNLKDLDYKIPECNYYYRSR